MVAKSIGMPRQLRFHRGDPDVATGVMEIPQIFAGTNYISNASMLTNSDIKDRCKSGGSVFGLLGALALWISIGPMRNFPYLLRHSFFCP